MKLMRICLAVILYFALTVPAFSQVDNKKASKSKDIVLPAPQTEKGKPLMQVLKKRQSSREYSTRDLSIQELSNLLWAANGISRPKSGKRTAPSAVNWQEIDIYVSKPDGLYLYNAQKNILEVLMPDDIREFTGTQPFVKDAPINLIFVADLSKTKKSTQMTEENINFYSAIDTGYISQNVYLYCASEGLATVVRGSFDKAALTKIMKLPETKKVIICQTVGYPAGNK